MNSGNRGHSFRISFDVTNTGKRDGSEVAQLYGADNHTNLPHPAKELKGFARVTLRAGEKQRVTLTLDERALSHYDVGSKQRRAEPGQFEVLVGRSVKGLDLRGTLTLPAPPPPPNAPCPSIPPQDLP